MPEGTIDRSTDNELLVMNQCKRKLDKMTARARLRVVRWLASKYDETTGEPVTE